MALTKEQTAVRDTRNKNMLVSAAAGSGKTFVLVQRIISEILDEKNGIDVDKILVVTFTNAAAAEMKDRIRKAIDQAVIENSKDVRIRTQATLIHSAHIRTIDSFCSWVVKNYFYEIDQDPAFRIGTTGEIKMLETDVFSDLLSQRLEDADEDFMLLADAYISGRNTSQLSELVFELYRKASSFAWINDWFDESLKLYDIDSIAELESSSFMQEIMAYVDMTLDALLKEVNRVRNLYDVDDDCPDKTLFENEYMMIHNAKNAKTFSEKYSIFAGMNFATFNGRKTTLDKDLLAYVKSIRDSYKKDINKLKADYFGQDLEELFDTLMFVKRQAVALINFARDYANALSEVKKKKNIYDFNDIEHMALEILRVKDSKEHEIRPVAVELANHFKEVMVDEYQDSNELQEQILTAITSGDNYFTVGDVKQSIYAFRQASPQLFIDKLYTYPMDDSADSVRIDLDKNFRSRWQVLELCNKIFEPLMQADMGGVIYDDKASLKAGDLSFLGSEEDYKGEILVAIENKDDMKEMEIASADELEAKMVATKINRLVQEGFMVSGKDTDGNRVIRPVKFSDIVILMRATSGHGEKYIEVLNDNGIQAFLAEEKGFFDREEIDTVLSLLTVIDNPFNDIPLAAVLHSPMFGFSSERLAQIRATDKGSSLYGCLHDYKNTNSDAIDVNNFFNILQGLRDAALDTPIHEMISLALEKTGYGVYVSALPQGKEATANLNKLIDEAVSFESTSYKGLSRFVSYIEGLKTYDEDLGLAKTVGENDNAVRIMTIHKSKGLEFPVVFLCGCGRSLQKEKGIFAYDQSLGVGLDYKNPVTRITRKTPFCNVIKAKNNASSRGEYLRILYVALTRPIDKLFITGTIASTKDYSVPDIIENMKGERGQLSFLTKAKATSSLELIIRALNASNYPVDIKIISCQDLFIEQVQKSLFKENAKLGLYKYVSEVDGTKDNLISENLSYEYACEATSNYKSKYSVSEIKHDAMEKTFSFNQDAAPEFILPEKEEYIPTFMRKDAVPDDSKVPAGALYGTAMHRFMECYDFTRDDLIESFDEQLRFMSKTVLSSDEFARINHNKLRKFIESEIAKRMHNAAVKNLLYKEKPFVFGATANELFSDENASDEMILVQGIIDVFFEEDDGIVLLDYKTDRVDSGNELVLRYEKQLQLYKNAIEKSYNVNVKQVLIYSFNLDETIII